MEEGRYVSPLEQRLIDAYTPKRKFHAGNVRQRSTRGKVRERQFNRTLTDRAVRMFVFLFSCITNICFAARTEALHGRKCFG